MGELRVRGKSLVSAEPDLVILSFTVKVFDKEYDNCIQNLNKKVEYLRQNIVACGLNRKDLKTSDFNVYVKTKEDVYTNSYKTVGYEAYHELHIELPMDRELLNKVLEYVAKGHSGTMIDISFSVSETDSVKKRAMIEAVQNAKENAKILASEAGVKLGRIIRIDHGFTEIRVSERRYRALCEQSPSYNVDIEPMDLGYEDVVTITYEIID